MYKILSLFPKIFNKSKIFLGNNIFIRPDSGMKEFTGEVINIADEDNYNKKLDTIVNWLKYYGDGKDDGKSLLTLISKAYYIESEWRFVVTDNEIITGSLYCKNGIRSLHMVKMFAKVEMIIVY